MTELFLMLADRNQHVDEFLIPSLNQNFIVLSDRYIDSTVAYQTIGKNININLINQLNKIVIKSAIPNLTFLMDSNIRQSLNKVKKLSKEYKGGDRIENKNLNYHLQVQKQYYSIQKKYPKRVIKINMQDSIDKTQEQIRTITLNYLKKKKIL